MYSPARSRARAAHSPGCFLPSGQKAVPAASSTAQTARLAAPFPPAAAKPQHAAVIARGVSTAAGRSCSSVRRSLPSRPVSTQAASSGQKASLLNSQGLGHWGTNAAGSPLCAVLWSSSSARPHTTAARYRRAKRLKGSLMLRLTSLHCMQRGGGADRKTAQGAPVGAPCWADAPGGIRSRRRTCRGWPGPPGSRPPHPAGRRLGSQKY